LPDEFASNDYGNKLPGIVPSEFVKEVYVLNEKQFWYKSFTNDENYLLTKQAEGQRGIDLGVPGAKKTYKTTQKKSYVLFEKKGGKAKMVELYIPVNHGIYLGSVLPLFIAAKYFQKLGIMTRISVVRMYQENSKEYVMWGFPVKDYGDEMDFNYMALVGVDNVWWQGIRTGVRAINAQIKAQEKLKTNPNFKYNASSQVDYYTGMGGLPDNSKSYVMLFAHYRNWYMEQIEKGDLKPLRVDKKLILSVRENVGSNPSEEKVKAQFYDIIDTVDFQFNKTDAVAKRIYKRMVENKLDEKYFALVEYNYTPDVIQKELNESKSKYTADFKGYVTNLLITTYTYPASGLYAESKESAEKLEDELSKKLEELSNFLTNV